jgi:putative SOS response-associated peptidase YedK
MEPIHERMPVILDAEAWPTWLGESGGDAGALLRPAPDDLPAAWPVWLAVNSPRTNGPELLQPVGRG